MLSMKGFLNVMARPFEGKVALVTGGNSGIGRSTAIKFAQEGAQVVIAARRVDEGMHTVESIRQAGGKAIFVRTDVAQAGEVAALMQKTVATYGRLDCAFNNAGTGFAGPLHELTEEEWDRVIDINLKGVWLCMNIRSSRCSHKVAGSSSMTPQRPG